MAEMAVSISTLLDPVYSIASSYGSSWCVLKPPVVSVGSSILL
jgi:hypothetical protein